VSDIRYYLDTSALLPLYRAEPFTPHAEQFLETTAPFISSLTEVEFASALARWVRTRELNEQQARQISHLFAEDQLAGEFVRVILGENHYWQAKQWLNKRQTPLRTLDALHLAICEQDDLVLVTADIPFSKSATALGMNTILLNGELIAQ
jgi:predicted nucleic acid-binding protein